MSEPTALIVVLSQAHNDPRVRHQITWLHDAGWLVDTVGLGPHPSREVRTHFELLPQASWVRTRVGAVIAYTILPKRAMFRSLALDRFPAQSLQALRAGGYSLLILEDFDFLPMITDPRALPAAARRTTHVHLDLHEYRSQPRVMTPWKRLTKRYRRWQRELIGSPLIDTRTTVARRISEMYASEFGFDQPSLVRNIPPFHEQNPSPVNPHEVRMVFHGMASWQRGFEQILDAMRQLDSRFTMTFMLTGNSETIGKLREAASDLGDRIRIVPPVPMPDISREINQYDLEIMFYPPVEPNVQFALPNKFFEAIQARLGLVVGESPMMAELVREHGLGPVVSGWSGADLARTLSTLTKMDIERYKQSSHRAAQVLNAEAEGRVFLRLVDPARTHA